ncbi:MAG TPA: hypothetical protein PKJ24_10825 [Prolixibacteraceae bacterium]|nr:hypothetical protein [Prolixibacteraceae bacterium]
MSESGTLVKLNALKHQLGFLHFRMECWFTMDWNLVREEMLELGENQFDLYTGILDVGQIMGEIDSQLLNHGIHDRESLKVWLGRSGYRIVHLSDSSKWVIRESDASGNPAHLHPARNQPMALRIKSANLRTAVAIMYHFRGSCPAPDTLNTTMINHIRKNLAGLSPVRSIRDCQRILQVLKFLQND